MFRRMPAAPHPHADLLEDGDADTVLIDRIGDTAQMPAIPADEPVTDVIDSITTAPTTIVQSAVEVTRADVAPTPRPRSAPERPRPSQSVPHRPRVSHTVPKRLRPSLALSGRPRTVQGWTSTLRDIRHDPMTMIYVLLIALAAVLTCWGTTVIFRPEWVPQVINPRPIPVVSTPADDTPAPVRPRVFVPHPRKPAEASQTAGPHPARAKTPRGAQRTTEKPQRGTPTGPSQQPPVIPSSPAPATPSQEPTPTREPDPTTQPPTQEPTPTERPSPTERPTTSEPTPTETVTQTERPTQTPTQTPTKTDSASAEPTRTQSQTPSGEPTRTSPEEPDSPSPSVG